MSEPSTPSRLRIYVPLLITAAVVLVIDQISKAWANGDWIFEGLDRCRELAERPTVGFCLAYNEGMAFSMGWGAGALIAPIALGIVAVLIAFAPKMEPLHRIMMGAIAGGAIGNLIDRAFRDAAFGADDRGFMGGAVVDFFYSSFFATFNVADAAIVVGGFLLAIAVYRMPDPDEADGAAEAADRAEASNAEGAGAELTPTEPTPAEPSSNESSDDS